MTDDEWCALYPYLLHRAPQGRPVGNGAGDLRQRMDAIFHMACRGYHTPWREVPEVYGRPDTVSRFFRRLTHGGLWHHLLQALADPNLHEAHPIRRLEHYVVRACRRAARLGGLRLIFLIKKVGLVSALNAPSWYLPDEHLSELARRLPMLPDRLMPNRPQKQGWKTAARRWIRGLKALHHLAGGRTRIPRAARLIWP